MVTSAHEGMHRIFQERPEILGPVFEVLGVPLSAKATVDVVNPDVTETRPLERRVDTVLRVGPSDGEDFLLAIEAQSGKKQAKSVSWAYYVSYLQSKYGLPVLLVVVCQDMATAKWATGPFDCGTAGWTTQRTTPLVVGPHNLPVITDARTALKMPALAAFSALAHARVHESQSLAILEPIAKALQQLGETDPSSERYFDDFLQVTLGDTPAGKEWSRIMTFVSYFPGRGTVRETAYLEGKAEGEAKGQAKGQAKGILSVLDVRGIPVSDSVRERIATCTDLDRVDAWLKRSLTVERAEDLFADE